MVFRNITYEQIYAEVNGLFQEFDYEMRELVDDYHAYCREENLVDQPRYILRIVPCGRTFEINLRHGIYYYSSDRGYSEHKYIGMYTNKAVLGLFGTESAFDAEFDDANFTKVIGSGRDTTEFDERSRQMIIDAKVECGLNVGTGHRFFCGKVYVADFQ